MKMLKYVAFLLALCICFDGSAKAKKTKKAKAKKTIVVDTCSVDDTFSYAMGIVNIKGLTNYLVTRLNVDTAYMSSFIEGFQSNLSTEEQKKMQAYVAGLQIAEQIEKQIIPGINKQISEADSTKALNEPLFLQGFAEALQNAPTQISQEQAEQLAEKQMKLYREAATERRYGENRRAGEAFLQENAQKEGVQTLPCGVQYKVLVQGEGDIPTPTSKVKVNYEGRLVDGTVFDSSYTRKKPTSFACNQVIKGWTEALTHMPVGSKWEIYIPYELGYGEREAGKIQPFSALIFTVELLEIEK